MRRGTIVGLVSASLTVGDGCAGSTRWECASWDGREFYVTEEEREALYPAEDLRVLLSARKKRKSGGIDGQVILAVIVVIMLGVAVAPTWDTGD